MNRDADKVIDALIRIVIYISILFFAGQIVRFCVDARKHRSYQIEEFQKDEVIVY